MNNELEILRGEYEAFEKLFANAALGETGKEFLRDFVMSVVCHGLMEVCEDLAGL